MFDPMTIVTLVLAGLHVASYVKDAWTAMKNNKPAPSVVQDPFFHGILDSVIEAAKQGKLNGDHPLLSVLQAMRNGVRF